tara:strand:- start:476 stop:1156 length:681 start_codon:yes stop_codon:yes gene_type:complete
MKKKIKSILGLSILEAVISTAIVGIGFVAILSMVNYSVQSIDTSGERTKANYLVSMMAEDVIGHKDSIYGINTNDKISIGIDGTVSIDGVEKPDARKFSDHLAGADFSTRCENRSIDKTGDPGDTPPSEDDKKVKSIYETQHVDAPSNKEEKWMRIFSENRYLKCKGQNDIKRMKVYKICRWPGVCPYQDPSITDDGMYIGRVQININNGKKRKFLYFQTDYKIRK